MAINITNLIKSLTYRINSSDPSPTAEDGRKLIAADKMSKHYNTLFYTSNLEFPGADSSNSGQLVYAEDSDVYYLSFKNDWKRIDFFKQDSAVFQEDDRFGGIVAGFAAGGTTQTGAQLSIIDRIPFANSNNSFQSADTSIVKTATSGQSSASDGYVSGGNSGINFLTDIDKYSFTSYLDAISVADLSEGKSYLGGHSSPTDGFASAGDTIDGAKTSIDKFPFSSDITSSIYRSIYNGFGGPSPTAPRKRHASHSSLEAGYITGGYSDGSQNVTGRVDKFYFASESYPEGSNPTLGAGSMLTARQLAASISSPAGAFTAAGFGTYQNISTIEYFPFAAESAKSGVGDASQAKRDVTGISSVTDGYIVGGFVPALNTIEKFPYAVSPVVITDLGDLTVARYDASGQQY